MKRRLILISVLSLGVATSSYNSERYTVKRSTPTDPDRLMQAVDSLSFSLDHLNMVLDEKRK